MSKQFLQNISPNTRLTHPKSTHENIVDAWWSDWYNQTARYALFWGWRWVTKGTLIVGNSRRNNKMPQITFLDFQMDRADEKPYASWLKQNEGKIPDHMDDILADGYKVSISPDFTNACTIVTLTCRAPGNPNEDTAFSTRAELWYDALCMALFKHLVLSDDGVWPTDKSSRNWG